MKKTVGLCKKECLALLCSVLLISFVFITGRLDKQKTWGTMEFVNLKFTQWENGIQYGIQNKGPSFNLPVGEYRLKFSVDTDGGGVIRLATTNDAPIEPHEFPFEAGQGEQVVSFRILESAKQMDIQVDFESGTYFQMGETRLYTPFYKDNAFTLLFVVIMGWLLYFWKRRGMTSEQWFAFLLLATAVLFASAPALKENLTVFHDTRYHSARLRNLADGLASGQFPVRLGGFSYNGYGAITSVFYPDLLLTPFALLLLAGCSIQYVMNLLLIFGNALAAFSMFYCGMRILKREKLALIASLLYVLSVYHITDGSVRYALGELMAMGFLPIFLAGLWQCIWGDSGKWFVLAIGASLIFMSHMLSTFLCVLLALSLCLPAIPKLIRERRILPILKAAALSALLCLFQIFPLLTYMREGIGTDASLFTTTMAGTALSPAQFFLLGAGNLNDVKDTTVSFMPLELGLSLWVGLLLACTSLKLSPSSEERDEHRTALFFLISGLFFMFMSSTWFPWSYVSVVTNLFDHVQFTYRYLMFPALLFSVLGAWGCRNYTDGKMGRITPMAVFILCVVSILPTISTQTRINEYYAFGTDVSPDIKQFTEYCIPGVDMEGVTRYRPVGTEGDVHMTDEEKLGSRFSAEVSSENGGAVVLPLFGFDGYAAKLNETDLAVECTEEGKLRCIIPEHSDGRLSVWFAGKTLWRVGDWISLLAWGSLLLWCWRKKYGKKYLQKKAA